MKKTAHDLEDVDEGFDEVQVTMKELDKVQTELIHLQGVLEFTFENLNVASKEFSICWFFHDVASTNLNEAFREVSNFEPFTMFHVSTYRSRFCDRPR